MPTRPPAAVETAAYFVVAEALANAIKYADATGIDVIAEDLALLRDNGLEVVTAVDDDGNALLRVIATEKPDIAIVDIRLPPTFRDEGVRAAIEARQRSPGTAILVVSLYVEQSNHRRVLAVLTYMQGQPPS